MVITAITSATPAPEPTDERSADRRPPQGPRPDSRTARQGDALVELARASLQPDSAGQAPSPIVAVNVHVGVETLVLDHAGECRIEGGCSLPPETARRLGCDATWITMIDDPDANPLYVSDAVAGIPRRMRRALQRRDGARCRFPGCHHPGHLEAHHIVHRAHGGPTRLDNLALLCKFHHHAVHEGGFRITTDGATLTFWRPNGSVLDSAPLVPDLTGPGVEDQNRQLGLHIDPNTIRSRWDGSRPHPQDLVDAVLPHHAISLN